MKKILRVGIATRREQIGKYAGGKGKWKIKSDCMDLTILQRY